MSVDREAYAGAAFDFRTQMQLVEMNATHNTEMAITFLTDDWATQRIFCTLLKDDEAFEVNLNLVRLMSASVLIGLNAAKLVVRLPSLTVVGKGRTAYWDLKSIDALVHCLLPKILSKDRIGRIAGDLQAMVRPSGVNKEALAAADCLTTHVCCEDWNSLQQQLLPLLKDNTVQIIRLMPSPRSTFQLQVDRKSSEPFQKAVKRSSDVAESTDRLKKRIKVLQQQNNDLRKAIEAAITCPIKGYVDPISPVICPEGHTFDKECILRWFKHAGGKSPVTRTKLNACDLVPNRAISTLADFYFSNGF